MSIFDLAMSQRKKRLCVVNRIVHKEKSGSKISNQISYGTGLSDGGFAKLFCIDISTIERWKKAERENSKLNKNKRVQFSFAFAVKFPREACLVLEVIAGVPVEGAHYFFEGVARGEFALPEKVKSMSPEEFRVNGKIAVRKIFAKRAITFGDFCERYGSTEKQLEYELRIGDQNTVKPKTRQRPLAMFYYVAVAMFPRESLDIGSVINPKQY